MKTLTQQFEKLLPHLALCDKAIGVGDCDCDRDKVLRQLLQAVRERDALVVEEDEEEPRSGEWEASLQLYEIRNELRAQQRKRQEKTL